MAGGLPVGAADLSVIPLPAKVDLQSGQFTLDTQTVIAADAVFGAEADYLAEKLRIPTGLRLGRTVGISSRRNAIVLAKPKRLLPLEGYTLDVGKEGVTIRATTPAGAFYGCQTLLQLLPVEALSTGKVAGVKWTMPYVQIEDAPRFGWRGLMLDESRHFFGKEVVKQLLDAMAHLKLNRFHWHLTDEPGWRIAITKYPKLAEIGGVGNWSDRNAPRRYYTQAEIREIIAYAQRRHIVIIPEIDMPGHATAATRSYPEISGGGKGRWQGFTFNPAKDETYRFLEDILREVTGLFPGPYLHIGGDEVSYGNQSWKTDPQIQQFIRDHDLKNEVGLERYFIRRMSDIVGKLGKTMVGWDEIIDAEVRTNRTAVMWWRHDKPAVLHDALAKDYPVVLCPRLPCYFDFVQDDSHKHGRRWKGFNDLERVYNFPESIQSELAAHESQVLGLQACVWTERIADSHRLGFMTFPRLAAIAEDGWTSPARKDWGGFRERVRQFLRYCDLRGLSYFNPLDPAKTPEPSGPEKADVLSDG